jgi:hypothetical protein
MRDRVEILRQVGVDDFGMSPAQQPVRYLHGIDRAPTRPIVVSTVFEVRPRTPVPARSSLRPVAWQQELDTLKQRLGPVFGRRELRASASAFLDGLLSGVERKTGWLMAEQAGLESPYRIQSLLGRSQWDAEKLRDVVRAYATEALGDADGVLVVDETGFLKKGTHSVGVARQYSGTAGRIENCQVGVFLAYASRYGQTLIDRQLYLPKDWSESEARRGGSYPTAAGLRDQAGHCSQAHCRCARCWRALRLGIGRCTLWIGFQTTPDARRPRPAILSGGSFQSLPALCP